jgi:hypothetical protein
MIHVFYPSSTHRHRHWSKTITFSARSDQKRTQCNEGQHAVGLLCESEPERCTTTIGGLLRQISVGRPPPPPPPPAFAGYCSGAQTLFAHNRLLARTIVSSSRHNNVSIHLSFPKSRFRRSCGARCSSLVKVSSSSLAFMMVDCSYAIRVHKLPSYSSAHSLDSTRTESLTCLISRINYG